MSYNLIENSNLYANTSSGTGNVSLKVSEVVNIANLIGTTHLSEGDILYLDCDFGSRIKVDQLRYYFSSTSFSGTIASGIAFYYKDDAPDSYSLLDTNIDAGYYYTTVPGLSAPRYLRVVHTITSGTAISGTVAGLSVLNEDDTVDFGSDGTAASFAATTSILGGSAEIRTVPIYNDGSLKATAYVTLEPQGTSVDELVTLSTTSGGPWYGVKENAQIIADADTWNEDGNLSDTEISSDLLQLQQREMSGTYTTKIFNNESKNSFVYLDIYSEPGDSFVTKDTNKEIRTIELRSTGQRPKDYALCRTFHYVTDGGYRWLYYLDRHRDDASTVYTSGYLGEGSHASYGIYVRGARADYESGKTAGFVDRTKYNFDWKQLRVFSISETGSYSDYVIVQQDGPTQFYNNCYKVEWDTNGGTWFYLYTGYSRSGYTLNQGIGYYLIRFNSGFSGTSCKLYSSSGGQAWDLSCVYNTGKLWYTDINTHFVRLIDTTGTEEVQYYDSEQIYGISATSDGGCWYVSGTNLKRLSSTGVLLTTLEDVGSTSLRYVLVDGDDYLYIRDGNYVKRLSIDGTVQFSTYVNQAYQLLQVTDTGIWIKTSGNRIRFVDSTGELKPTNISYSYGLAVMEYSYDSEGHGFHVPISIDSHWQNLEWEEVRPDKYPMPSGDDYFQARITIQSNRPDDVYDVPADETWTPNDYFTQTNGTGPHTHRWVASDDTSSIAVVSNRLRFYGGVGSTKSIHSYGRWYIETDDNSDIDLQLYYRLPGTWNPPPVNIDLYFRLYAMEPAYSGYYVEGFMRRKSAGNQNLRIRVWDGSSHDGNWLEQGQTYNYGYIRILRDISENRWYAYDYINGTWQYSRLDNMSSYPVGNKFYIWIYVADYGSGNDVEIDSFVFNQNIDDVAFDDWVTPQLQNIYLQKSIEVPDIYPNTAKDTYLKLEVPTADMGWAGSYNTNLKAWWEIPT